MNPEHHEIVVQPDLGIELPDGTRLSARVWRPAGKDLPPLPAIVEYLPYRKADGTAERDDTMHPIFASRGYVCLRVDRRGCGDSEGLFDDEYSEQELRDGVDVLDWIAAQPWCDGRIGMQGISWGGFNGLQIAARRPGPLKAVISIASSVDRFADDIHYEGGIQLGENVGWATTVLSWFSMPPDPAIVGDRWRDLWLERLEHTPFLGREWLGHPDRDAYWRHGSVCEDFDAIRVPVLALGGQHDGYRDTVSRLVSGLGETGTPVKGVLGPWSHKYPHLSTVGPSIDYVALALRWWDRWLKGRDTGVEALPAYTAYVVDSAAPDASANHRTGRWVTEFAWPSPACRDETLVLGPGTLVRCEGPVTEENAGCDVRIDTDLAVGRDAGEFFPFGFGSGELPGDQRHDDALSARFDSAPSAGERILLGAPTLRLRLSSDRPRAQLIARLCDVRPDGGVMLIGLGLLNLRHRDGFERARDLVPGEAFDAVLELDQVAYRLPAGHRLRIALSTSYWPYCWPEGQGFTLTVSGGTLSLPVRHRTAGGARDGAAGGTGDHGADDALDVPMSEIAFAAPPDAPASTRFRTLRAPRDRKERHEDPATGTIRLSIHGDHGSRQDLDSGLITGSDMAETWEIERDDPASARVEMVWNRTLARGDWRVGSRVTTRMRGLARSFELHQTLEAFEGDELVFTKTFETSVPRHDSRHEPFSPVTS